MKIQSLSETPRTERGPTDKSAPASAAAAPASGAKVELSELAARLNQLETQFADADFDADKVEAIRTAIAAGRFEVKAGAIADGLLESVDQFLGRKA